jgi:thioesterase DpgC
MDEVIGRAVATLTDSGLVSAAANRKALRVAQEPLDTFRQYMALYAREQAYCHFSPALVRNLEQNWVARDRPADAKRAATATTDPTISR